MRLSERQAEGSLDPLRILKSTELNKRSFTNLRYEDLNLAKKKIYLVPDNQLKGGGVFVTHFLNVYFLTAACHKENFSFVT